MHGFNTATAEEKASAAARREREQHEAAQGERKQAASWTAWTEAVMQRVRAEIAAAAEAAHDHTSTVAQATAEGFNTVTDGIDQREDAIRKEIRALQDRAASFYVKDGILHALRPSGAVEPLGNVIGPQGERGPQGESVVGPPGPRGETGAKGVFSAAHEWQVRGRYMYL
jgi:hypothetical protein